MEQGDSLKHQSNEVGDEEGTCKDEQRQQVGVPRAKVDAESTVGFEKGADIGGGDQGSLAKLCDRQMGAGLGTPAHENRLLCAGTWVCRTSTPSICTQTPTSGPFH